jgi:hypothetical protein
LRIVFEFLALFILFELSSSLQKVKILKNSYDPAYKKKNEYRDDLAIISKCSTQRIAVSEH